MTTRATFAFTSLIALAAACARYEWKPDYETHECAGYSRPASRIVPDSSAVSGSDDVLTLRVVRARDDTPLDGAAVWVTGPERDSARLSDAGEYHSRRLEPGRYALVVRRLGYDVPRDSVTLHHAGGVRLIALMEPAPLDGPCSGFAALRVRKPWWKWW